MSQATKITLIFCRQQRAALCIQRNWRRHQARQAWLLHRRRVVRLQCLWRVKMARRELRKRRASQREAGKLLQVCTLPPAVCSACTCVVDVMPLMFMPFVQALCALISQNAGIRHLSTQCSLGTRSAFFLAVCLSIKLASSKITFAKEVQSFVPSCFSLTASLFRW